MEGSTLYPCRNRTLAPLVSFSSEKGFLLVAHRNGTPVYSLYPKTPGQEPEAGPHPGVVYYTSRAGARLLPRPFSSEPLVSGFG